MMDQVLYAARRLTHVDVIGVRATVASRDPLASVLSDY